MRLMSFRHFLCVNSFAVGTNDISSLKCGNWKVRRLARGHRADEWWSQISSAGILTLEPNNSAQCLEQSEHSKNKWQFLSSFLPASGQFHAQTFVVGIRPWIEYGSRSLLKGIETHWEGVQGRARVPWCPQRVDPWATNGTDRAPGMRRRGGWQEKDTG